MSTATQAGQAQVKAQTIEWIPSKVKSSTGLNMAFETAGPEGAPELLLVAGLGCQLTMWHEEFCQPLLNRGLRLIRFDNRDIGLTDDHPSSMKVNIPLTFVRSKLGLNTPSNYLLELMADDALGLIDALGLKQPHVCGVSMGGMIAQIMAAKAPGKIGKLITLMSSTNNPKLPGATPNVLYNMFLKKPKSQQIDDVVEHVERVMTAIGSPGYPLNVQKLRERTRRAYMRAYRPAGVIRQIHCVVSTGSIERFTKQIQSPTCVIHGLQDPLLKKECSERIHSLVPGSKLRLIEGLGHDLPDELSEHFADIIFEHIND